MTGCRDGLTAIDRMRSCSPRLVQWTPRSVLLTRTGGFSAPRSSPAYTIRGCIGSIAMESTRVDEAKLCAVSHVLPLSSLLSSPDQFVAYTNRGCRGSIAMLAKKALVRERQVLPPSVDSKTWFRVL